MLRSPLLFLLVLPLLPSHVAGVAGDPTEAEQAPSSSGATSPPPAIRWDSRAAEHLLNRAGFGGTSADVNRLVALGHSAAVATFFPDPALTPRAEILASASLHGGLEHPEVRHETVEKRREGYSRLQPDLILPLNKYGDWWIERMVTGEDPLRERMTIFWHGHFVSSVKDVGNAHDMIRQMEFLRDNALGPFETLVRGIGRDPAMLRYLNNDTNVKDHPNENWARELMELFSLGDGNYTEPDIKEAARAFTGWSRGPDGFEYKRLDHDFGHKRVLALHGNLDGDHVVDVVLEQPACGRFLAHKLIAHFEGTPPTEERLEDYAAFLRANDYDIGGMMRRLLLDPEFYRDEVVSTRVVPPVEFVVSAARRLGIHPPGQMVLNAGDVLGQRLFWPPSVKGWEEGMAWITTSSMMQRSNMVGVMLGLVEVSTLLHDEEFAPTSPDAPMTKRMSRTNGFNQLDYIQLTGWEPDASLCARVERSGKTTDEAIANWMAGELLGIPYAPDTTRGPYDWLRERREEAGIAEGDLAASGERGELILRGLAHLILSLPEAQVN